MRYAMVVVFAVLAVVGLAQSSNYQGVATAKQIMAGVQKPAMDSLVAVNKAGGPKDDKEWELVAQHSALLAETAQLLQMGTRPLDQEVWINSAQRLNSAAAGAVKAAGAKDLTAWQTSFNTMGQACRACHKVHKKDQKKQQ